MLPEESASLGVWGSVEGPTACKDRVLLYLSTYAKLHDGITVYYDHHGNESRHVWHRRGMVGSGVEVGNGLIVPLCFVPHTPVLYDVHHQVNWSPLADEEPDKIPRA